jgi:hypothetical protein
MIYIRLNTLEIGCSIEDIEANSGGESRNMIDKLA